MSARHLAEKARVNLWLLPMLIVLAAVMLSIFTLRLDARVAQGEVSLPFLFTGGADGATAILTAVASSMIGVTGVIFSITVVSLTLASNQFGPRLLREFISDRVTQTVLGVFLATFTFSLVGLHAIDRTAGATAVPRLTVTVAIALVFASLALLIIFIHHIATSIQADTVVARVSEDLRKAIQDLYPEKLGGEDPGERKIELPSGFEEGSVVVRAARSGYVQTIEEKALMRSVVREGAVLKLDVRPGDFVAERGVVGRAWSADGVDAHAAKRIGSALRIGEKPTPEQDVEHLISQLVEVAVRALSPGINDPFTAMRAVDHLSAALCDLGGRRFPSTARTDESGRVRVVAKGTTWAGAVDAAFDQVRQHAATNVALTLRLLEALTRIAETLPRGDPRREVLARQVAKIAEARSRAGFGREDAADVDSRVDDFARSNVAGRSRVG